jgi:hypothetical protein
MDSVLSEIRITDDCNYIAAFLTMACPYRCPYCINEFESGRRQHGRMSGEQWVQGLSRLANLEREEGIVPVTLQGGEPSVHPDFYYLIQHLPERIRLDILTNLCFDVEEMIARVNPERLRREAPYASIRVSYHPSQVRLDDLLAKVHRLLEAKFSVGIWGLLHPDQAEHILQAQTRAKSEGIDFRTKEFLGFADGKLHGEYRYPEACFLQETRHVLCRTTELIVGPDGGVHRCHHDLYEHFPPIGHILDPEFAMTGEFLPCDCFGHCNPCDIKVKTNRLQQFGHTSVAIKFVDNAKTSRPALAATST